jgi:capsular exopolysaccharide synthesis family protein
VAVWFLAPPPKSTVQTLLRVPAGAPYLFRTLETVPDAQTHQRNQIAMGKSRLVLTKALQYPALAEVPLLDSKLDPLAWLETYVLVDFTVAPEIMKISMKGAPAEEEDLGKVVNAIREAYLEMVVDRDKFLRRQRLDYVDKHLAKYDEMLREKRKPREKLEAELGGSESAYRARMVSFLSFHLIMSQREFEGINRKLRLARSDVDGLQAKAAHFDKVDFTKALEPEIHAALAKDPEILDTEKKIKALQTQITATLDRSAKGEREPAVVKARRDVKRLEGQLKQMSARLRPDLVARLRKKARLDIQARLAIREAEMATLERAVESLKNELGQEEIKDAKGVVIQKEVRGLIHRVADLSAKGVKFDKFMEETATLETMSKRLKTEREALELELGAPSRVVVLEEATVSRPDKEMRKVLMAAGAAAGALFFVLLAVAWLEYRARRVDQIDEVVYGLGMRLVGTVPRVARSSAGKPGRGAQQAQQMLTESVDAARTMLMHLARTESLRTVMLTSATAGEGKTSLSCRLATSLARAGLRTLLIDADTRNPSVHKVFGAPAEPGFCEVLAGKADLESCLRTTPAPNLFVLPAGRWSEQFPVVLGRGGAGALFAQLHQDFDLVLVDSPPVLPVADALQMGQQVDGVLLSVLCQVSRLPTLYAASHRLEELNIRTLGVVINGSQEQLPGASYRYPSLPTPKDAVKA